MRRRVAKLPHATSRKRHYRMRQLNRSVYVCIQPILLINVLSSDYKAGLQRRTPALKFRRNKQLACLRQLSLNILFCHYVLPHITTPTPLSASSPTILIVGTTGNTGRKVVETLPALLKNSKSLSNHRILCLTRSAQSDAAQKLAKIPGIEILEENWVIIANITLS